MSGEEQEAALDALATASAEEARAALARLVSVTTATMERRAQLERALSSRIVIEQAKGVLAGRHGIGVEEAFDVLRGTARKRQLKLHELAQQVVESDETPQALAAALAARPPSGG